jgi:hypothetical protein
MIIEPDILSTLRRFLPTASVETSSRINAFSAHDLAVVLDELSFAAAEISLIARQWDRFRTDETWSALLADLVTMVESQRGDVDAPIHVWPDLDKSGLSGRFLFFYVFALCCEGTTDFLRAKGCPEDVISLTRDVLARHAQIHQLKFGTTGVDAGWWMVPVLRGEIVSVGSLQFHFVNLDVGSLTPRTWYDESEAAALGAGFRRGDASIGLHIPDQTDLSPEALDRTFDRARTVLSAMWPASQRRLATCESWMLDDRLNDYLNPSSNILRFQQRFKLLANWCEDDENVLEFVFRSPVVFSDLRPKTTLERAVVNVIAHGGHWRDRTGWFEFDGG